MGIDDVEIKVIKWERIENENREEKMEREMIFATNANPYSRESKIIMTAKSKRA